MTVRLPDEDDRTMIVGSTGSGKTFAGIWLLSTRNYWERPTVIFDFKGDKLISSLPAKVIGVRAGPPRDPGLYIVRPLPGQEELVEAFLWKCWAQEDMILYFDEGYMVGRNNKAYNAIMTQGRAKLIEVITLSQRPLWLSRFAFSEATFFQIFDLTDYDDRKTVSRFIRKSYWDPNTELPRFHSVWYDVGRKEGVEFSPVPSRSEILASFTRLERPKAKVI